MKRNFRQPEIEIRCVCPMCRVKKVVKQGTFMVTCPGCGSEYRTPIIKMSAPPTVPVRA